MKCPRCGADNAERSVRCYLCEYTFVAGDTAPEPPGAEGPPQPQYPPPGVPEGLASPGLQAGPPPPMMGTGYQPPPPGAHPAGFQPPPAAPKGPPTVKVIIGILVILLVVIVGVTAFFLIRGKTYSVSVPAPPGYEAADEQTLEAAKESMHDEAEDADLDYLFVNGAGTSFVFVAHQRFYLTETPPDDPEEAERYYNEHKNELMEEMNLGFETAGGMSGDIAVGDYETMRLGTGDTALHFSMSLTVQGVSMDMETLIVVKGKTMFMVIVQGFEDTGLRSALDYLAQNITFSE